MIDKWNQFIKSKPRNKYGANKCEYKGIKFDSTKEMYRYIFLENCQSKGLISNLRRQVKFELFPDEYTDVVKHLKTKDKVIKKRTYIGVDYTADFVYNKGEKEIIEDVKGSKEVITRDAELRIKILHYVHGLDVKIVYNPTEDV